MLIHLQVDNFTLVSKLSLDFTANFTVLTGETGAGKSILLDALGLATGDRADTDRIKSGADKAEVSASFDVVDMPHVSKWLDQADLGSEECIIRRVVTAEGRSRAYINGQIVTLSQLRQLGSFLVDIHSQHEHQSLLQVATHRRLLDDYGQLGQVLAQVKKTHTVLQKLKHEVAQVSNSHEELNARYQLLNYQLDELNQLGVSPGECEQLESRQKQLANAAEITQTCQRVSDLCFHSEQSVSAQLNSAIVLIESLPANNSKIKEVELMLREALIQVDEAAGELQNNVDEEHGSEDELIQIEKRLTAIYDVARKHKVPAEEIPQLHAKLTEEISGLSSGDQKLEELQLAMAKAGEDYSSAADKLSAGRKKTVKAFSKAVNNQLGSLGMAHAKFEVSLAHLEAPSRYGSESVEFLISTIPGQAPRPMVKIVSGGELSRIGLSIQVVAAKTTVIPTIVFDEVDAGIGGETGDVVGRMLRTLGESTQVICVTHLAQVASKAHEHLKVEKTLSKRGANTVIGKISAEEKVGEIARMMGGAIESEQSIAHAREMLEA